MSNKIETILELRHLYVEREVTILRDINWRVDCGQHWAILGANGSGKTTLINVLNAYMWPSSGEIFVLGEQYGRTDWRELRLVIGIVSSSIAQRIDVNENALETVMTGKDANINFWGRASKKDKKEALSVLRSVECVHLAERKWKYLSLGERQRVLIGRALMSQLKILILDEPCAGLDPVARQKFLDFIGRLSHRKNAPTIIFITHHIEEIIPCFTHIMLLKSGKVLASGKKKNVLTSSNLSKAFGAQISLKKNKNQFVADIKLGPRFIA